MRQLADEVGVQAAALYRYFPTKEELLFTLMREHMEGLAAAWQATRPANDDPVARLAAYRRQPYRLPCRAPPRDASLQSGAAQPVAGEADEILKLRTAYEKELRAILREGAEPARSASTMSGSPPWRSSR